MRVLHWAGYFNCRDLGTLPAREGRTQLGRIARGPRRELLAPEGWTAARLWGLRTIIDLRCPDEVGHQDGDPMQDAADLHGIEVITAPTEDHADDEFRRICFPILDSPEYWGHNLRILPVLVRHALEAIARAKPGILVHCSAGRDRTGMITALLLANAGVDPEAIVEDYAESVRAMAGAESHSPTHDRQATWSREEVAAWLNATVPIVVDFAEHIDDHLEQIGLHEADRERLRRLLLET